MYAMLLNQRCFISDPSVDLLASQLGRIRISRRNGILLHAGGGSSVANPAAPMTTPGHGVYPVSARVGHGEKLRPRADRSRRAPFFPGETKLLENDLHRDGAIERRSIMSTRRASFSDHRRSSPWWLAKLLFVFALAMAVLSSVAAYAEEGAFPISSTAKETTLDKSTKPYRQRALTALLTNERRSLHQRIDYVLRELERIGADASSEDVQPALTELRQKLIAFEQRLDEIEAELAKLGQSEEAAPEIAEGVDRMLFIPASKPRQPDASTEGEQTSFQQRRQIQEALVFFGGYDSSIDGDFGARTEAAIRRYQGKIGAEPTGQLTKEQVNRLLDSAAARRRESGLKTLTDDDIGFRLSYPSAFLAREEFAEGSYHILSDDSGQTRLQVVTIDSRDLRTIYDDLTRHAADGYRHMAETWFVASGEVEDEMFYAMGRRNGDRSIVVHLTYPSAARERWDPFTVMLYNSFELTRAG